MTSLKIYCDGGSRGNPGPGAFAFIVKNKEQIIYKEAGTLGETTNNIAEYTAVLKALEWLARNYSITQLLNYSITFYLDSLLVVQQLTGKYKIKNIKLRELAIKIKSLENKLAGQVFYLNVPRELNVEADRLLNLELDKHFTSVPKR